MTCFSNIFEYGCYCVFRSGGQLCPHHRQHQYCGFIVGHWPDTPGSHDWSSGQFSHLCTGVCESAEVKLSVKLSLGSRIDPFFFFQMENRSASTQPELPSEDSMLVHQSLTVEESHLSFSNTRVPANTHRLDAAQIFRLCWVPYLSDTNLSNSNWTLFITLVCRGQPGLWGREHKEARAETPGHSKGEKL